MIVLTCRRCKGSGEVPNLQYEICQKMTSAAARQHFCIPGTDECEDAEEWVRLGCAHEKTLPCPVCGGDGVLEFDEEDWDLSIDEDDGEEGNGTHPGSTSGQETTDLLPPAPAGNVTTPP
ncbi:MAG: hypothetical protein LUP93_07115 [Methanomicrobiales archaeon]|jgi:hypothetical protein|nr:hypothetical protein [Methanomicrobiales archaeon]